MTSFRVVQEVIQYLVICLNRTLSCIIAIVMTHTPYIVILNKQNTKHKRINANYNSQGGLIHHWKNRNIFARKLIIRSYMPGAPPPIGNAIHQVLESCSTFNFVNLYMHHILSLSLSIQSGLRLLSLSRLKLFLY